jgi:hypothetical protein
MKYVFSIACLIFIISCKKAEVPIIEESKMIKILADLHISESALGNVDPKVKDSLSIVYMNQILKIYKVNKSDFDQSLRVYNHDPKKLEKMYDKILLSLEENSNK